MFIIMGTATLGIVLNCKNNLYFFHVFGACICVCVCVSQCDIGSKLYFLKEVYGIEYFSKSVSFSC